MSRRERGRERERYIYIQVGKRVLLCTAYNTYPGRTEYSYCEVYAVMHKSSSPFNIQGHVGRNEKERGIFSLSDFSDSTQSPAV